MKCRIYRARKEVFSITEGRACIRRLSICRKTGARGGVVDTAEARGGDLASDVSDKGRQRINARVDEGSRHHDAD